MIGSVITQVFAVGVLPFALASLVCLAAREILLWPLFEAKLWGAAACFLLAGIGYWLSKRFLEAGDRKPPAARGWPLSHEASLAPYAFDLSRGGGLPAGPVLGGAFPQPVALLLAPRRSAGLSATRCSCGSCSRPRTRTAPVASC